jgi:PPM family protein phosphatase
MTAHKATKIEAYSQSDIGNVREDNQDAVWLCNPEDQYTEAFGHLYAIADGMGGYAHGGVASSLALSTFCETFYDAGNAAIPQKMKIGMQNANLSVYQAAQKISAGRMGTTLTAANLVGNTLHIAHIGDSRAYLIRKSKSRCLTNDHTRVGELVRMRLLSADKIRSHNQRSVLNKCLGMNLFIQPDIFNVQVQTGDALIFCTDGVWSVIEDEEFGEIAATIHDPALLGKRILELALERDSDDNVSLITVFFHQLDHQKDDSAKNKHTMISRIFRQFSKKI